MRRLTAIVLSAMISLSLCGSSSAIERLVFGDLDGGKTVDIFDVNLLLRYAAGASKYPLSPCTLYKADVSPEYENGTFGNGRLDVSDVIALLRRIAKVDTRTVWPKGVSNHPKPVDVPLPDYVDQPYGDCDLGGLSPGEQRTRDAQEALKTEIYAKEGQYYGAFRREDIDGLMALFSANVENEIGYVKNSFKNEFLTFFSTASEINIGGCCYSWSFAVLPNGSPLVTVNKKLIFTFWKRPQHQQVEETWTFKWAKEAEVWRIVYARKRSSKILQTW